MKTPTSNILPPLTRRQFIRHTAGVALPTGLGTCGALSQAAALRTPWPVAVRDGHLKFTRKPDCWSALKELGLGGLEVLVDEAMNCPGLYHPEKKYSLATPDGMKELKDDLAAHGATMTALCMSNRLDERLEQEIEWARNVVAAAAACGVKAVRIDVVPRKVAADAFAAFAIPACRRLAGLAEGTPVRFGIENHGKVTNDPAFLERLFHEVNSPHMGLTLDAMNFYWFGHPLDALYGIYEKFASRTVHTHCKNLRYPDDKKNARRPIGWEYAKHAVPLDKGDIDFSRVAQILRQAGYAGDLCLENECLGPVPEAERTAVLKREVALLQRLSV